VANINDMIDNEIRFARGYGFSNVEHRVPVKIETVFQSGSVGKQFTSMAIMLLVERHRIELDAKIPNYLTDVPNTWENITIRHLLSHTSGMTGYSDALNLRHDYREVEIYETIKQTPLAFKPGDRWAYSNFGYIILGILIERVTGRFYGDFLRENIFCPLAMSTAQVINENEIIPNRASGYILVDGKLENQPWVAPIFNTLADGSLYLTVNDMAKWDEALYNDQLLKEKASFDAMWSPTRLNNNTTYDYGFGWWLIEAINGVRMMEHGGSWQGFRSIILRAPKSQLTVVLFTNLNHQNANVRLIAHRVLQICDPQLAVKPKISMIESFHSK
jgi:CubicO group peptidase (beta-lactamase class C family)